MRVPLYSDSAQKNTSASAVVKTALLLLSFADIWEFLKSKDFGHRSYGGALYYGSTQRQVVGVAFATNSENRVTKLMLRWACSLYVLLWHSLSPDLPIEPNLRVSPSATSRSPRPRRGTASMLVSVGAAEKYEKA